VSFVCTMTRFGGDYELARSDQGQDCVIHSWPHDLHPAFLAYCAVHLFTERLGAIGCCYQRKIMMIRRE
jgi:hypothetical protein